VDRAPFNASLNWMQALVARAGQQIAILPDP
jgi:hypothetical protein